jgi:hypothetical protein
MQKKAIKYQVFLFARVYYLIEACVCSGQQRGVSVSLVDGEALVAAHALQVGEPAQRHLQARRRRGRGIEKKNKKQWWGKWW